MARSLLVAPVADHSGLARTCLGLLRALDRQGVKVAFVKPVAQSSADGGPDRSAELVAAVTALRPPEPLSTPCWSGSSATASWKSCWRRSSRPGSRSTPGPTWS